MSGPLSRQWFYDGLPKDADDEAYALADAIYESVAARAAAPPVEQPEPWEVKAMIENGYEDGPSPVREAGLREEVPGLTAEGNELYKALASLQCAPECDREYPHDGPCACLTDPKGATDA